MMIIVVIGVFAGILGLSPIIALLLICSAQDPGTRCTLILLYPFILALLILLLITIFTFYPVMRNFYHHGIYDGMDTAVINVSICYLGFAAAILGQ